MGSVCIEVKKKILKLSDMYTWYTDLDTMQEDDRYLQKVYATLRRDLSQEAQEQTKGVHVYPSVKCSYTIAKERIFIKVRDENHQFVPECILRHVLMHELAHTINPTEGHDGSFWRWLRCITQGGRVSSCPKTSPLISMYAIKNTK